MENLSPFIALVVKVAGFLALQYVVILVVDFIYKELDRSIERTSPDPKLVRSRVDLLTLVVIFVLLVSVDSLNSDTGGAVGQTRTFLELQATKVSLLLATQTPTPTQTPTSTLTPTSTITPTPSITPIPTLIPTDEPRFIVSRTTEQELTTIPSIYIENKIDLTINSGVYSQSNRGSVSSSDRYRWPFTWCAVSKNFLNDNLSNMTVNFIVDDKYVSQSDVYTYNTTSVFGKCNNWSVTLSGWRSGSQVNLRIEVGFQEDIFDGQDIYSSGTYNFELIVDVK